MPELIWKGKPAVSYIGEEIQERFALSEPTAQQLSTYQSFDGTPSNTHSNPQQVSTQHWRNRLILGDKSAVLPALLPEFAGQVDLIYIDPPFMSGRDFISGTQLAFSDKWGKDPDAYLQWLYETFVLLKLLLAHDGSLYVHLDWRVIHYARVILDQVFGFYTGTDGPGFKNEIIWHYQSGGRSLKRYARKHDSILFYSKSAQYCFHGERIGERRGTKKRNHMKKSVDINGHVHWTIHSAGRLYSYDEDTSMTPTDVWSDICHLHQKNPERNGYATQKPSALLERIILASSEENDLVLDCFCGSGVTPTVAERLGRRWIACDKSELALTLTRERLLAQKLVHPFVLQQLSKESGEQVS